MREASITERADQMLRLVAERTRVLGRGVECRLIEPKVECKELNDAERNYLEFLAYTGCFDNSDFLFLVNYLDEQRLAMRRDRESVIEITVLVPGYQRLDKIDQVGADAAQAFVAMWFHPSTVEAYEQGLDPAIRDAGYNPLRIDQKDHNNRIDDEIIAEIRRSRFVVADFTQGRGGARGGVYYEAGFAHGLTLPVIFTCRMDCMKKLHFDTRQYNHIAWSGPADLRKQLRNRIAAVIGDGPLKK